MFYSSWDVVARQNRRVCIPKRFRDELGREVMLVQDKRGFLVFPGGKIKDLPRAQLGWVCLLRIDRQGRILIPKNLHIFLPDRRRLILVGRGDHFKIQFPDPNH